MLLIILMFPFYLTGLALGAVFGTFVFGFKRTWKQMVS